MRAVSPTFTNNSQNPVRVPSYQVKIDWDLDGIFDDESFYVVSLGIERTIEEPLGGISTCLADVVLSNTTNRFTPR